MRRGKRLGREKEMSDGCERERWERD